MDGDNQFYILVSSNTKEETSFYELTIHRSYEVDINYWFNDEIFSNYKLFTGNKNSLIEFNVNGYSFNGWLTDNQDTAKENIVWEEQNFYADTTPNAYQISFNTNGGSEIVEQATVTYGEDFTLPVPIRQGYTFCGWYKEPDFYSSPITNGKGESLDKWSENNNLTCFACWLPNIYNVSLTPTINKSCELSGSGKYYFDSEATITCEPFLGYEFVGWYNNNVEVSKDLSYRFIVGAENNLIAETKIKDEMADFIFLSTKTSCNITELKDKAKKDIVVPDYATIENGAFYGASWLERLTIPKHNYLFGTLFGSSFFTNSVAIQQQSPIYLGSNPTGRYNVYTFYLPKTLKSVTVKGGYIAHGAFRNITLDTLHFGKNVSQIQPEAFKSSNVESVFFEHKLWTQKYTDHNNKIVTNNITFTENGNENKKLLSLSYYTSTLTKRYG